MRVLAGVGGFAGLARPEMAHHVGVLPPDIERRPFATVGCEASIVLGKIIADTLVEFEVSPAPLARESDLARHRRATDNCQGNALFEIDGGNIERAEQRCAHRTRPFALRTIHPEIGDKRVVLSKHVDQPDPRALLIEKLIRGRLATMRQRSTLLCHPLDMTTELNFFHEQRRARHSVSGAVVGIWL